MALIKKQIFRPSKDENFQQFFAKEHGENMEMRWGQPSSKDKPNTQARKKGLVRGVPEKAGDAAKKVTPKKAEPKSPWDDESDALTQKAFEVDPEGGTRRVPSADDKKKADRAKRDRLFERSVKYVKNFEDQGSDNSNSADDTTGKQIKLAVQDAWFEKKESLGAFDHPEGVREPVRGWGGPKQGAIQTPAKAENEADKRPPGKGQKAKWVAEDYDADEDGPHKVEGHWKSKMQKAVWEAWMEKKEEGAESEEERLYDMGGGKGLQPKTSTGSSSWKGKKITNPNNPHYTGNKKGDKSFRSKHEWDDTTPHAESYAEWKERLSNPDTQEQVE